MMTVQYKGRLKTNGLPKIYLGDASDFGVAFADDGEIAVLFGVKRFGFVNGVVAADFQAAIEQGLQAFDPQKVTNAHHKHAIADLAVAVYENDIAIV